MLDALAPRGVGDVHCGAMLTKTRHLLLITALALGQAQLSPAQAASAPELAARPLSQKDLPAWVKPQDRLEQALGWTDKEGENVILFTSKESSRKSGEQTLRSYALTVLHLVRAKGQVRTLRTLRDQEERCEFDLVGRIVADSVKVTDLDQDGTGEVTFAYELGCRSDVSPDTRKLVVLQGGQKYILRGESRVDVGNGEKVGGKFKADPATDKWPKPLLDHAAKQWQRLL